jgi:hypothetical protein
LEKVDRSYVERNRSQTERLKALSRLSDEELRHPIGEHWTVGIMLAHLAYWGVRAIGALAAWRQYQTPLVLWIAGESFANDLWLPVWKVMPPRQALDQAIDVSTTLDDVLASLTDQQATELAAVRYRTLEPAIHRAGHLDEVDRALAR